MYCFFCRGAGLSAPHLAPVPSCVTHHNTWKSESLPGGPYPSGPGQSGSWGTCGGQAGYAAILLLEKNYAVGELGNGPLRGRSIERRCRRPHSPDGPIRAGPNSRGSARGDSRNRRGTPQGCWEDRSSVPPAPLEKVARWPRSSHPPNSLRHQERRETPSSGPASSPWGSTPGFRPEPVSGASRGSEGASSMPGMRSRAAARR